MCSGPECGAVGISNLDWIGAQIVKQNHFYLWLVQGLTVQIGRVLILLFSASQGLGLQECTPTSSPRPLSRHTLRARLAQNLATLPEQALKDSSHGGNCSVSEGL